METATETETKPCIHCASPIAPAARLCVHCRSSQTRWVSTLVTLGAVSTGLTLMASLLLYLFSTGPGAVRQWLGHDVAVVALNFHDGVMTSPRLVVQNQTDTDTYLARLQIAYPSIGSARVSRALLLDMTVEAGKTATRAPNWAQTGGEKVRYTVPYARGVEADWRLGDADVQRLLEQRDCLSLDVEAPAEIAFAHFEEFIERRGGQRLMRADVEVVLHYYSTAKQRWRELPVPAVAILRRKDSALCVGVTGGLDAPEVQE